MKKKLLAGLCLSMIMSVSVFTGCGTGGSNTSTTSQQTTMQTETNSVPETTEAETTAASAVQEEELNAKKEALREEFLAEADKVEITEDSVIFQDASAEGAATITVSKNPQKVVNLYGSFTTLWYEAGGSVIGCIGGDSTVELYNEYIGRDITQDEGVTVVATSSSGKKWDTETIVALQPDLIICSTAMSGYSTIQAPAQAAGIPVIAVSYNDFRDYLKSFKVFCNLNGQPELWDSVAMKALDEVVEVLANCPTEDNPTVFSMFSGSESLQANTSNTVVGSMITAMNAHNIVDGWDNSTGADRLEINLETVYLSDPDIIVVQCHAGAEEAQKQVEELYGNDAVWQSLKAVKEGRVYYLEKALFHNKPNSRFAEAYQKLAEILYPDVEIVSGN